jgi:hypothetical protein
MISASWFPSPTARVGKAKASNQNALTNAGEAWKRKMTVRGARKPGAGLDVCPLPYSI